MAAITQPLPIEPGFLRGTRPRGQLLKWVGNKFRQAELIAANLPVEINEYYEPFVGTGAVLSTLGPQRAIAGDALGVLVEFHQLVQSHPEHLIAHYATARGEILAGGRDAYEAIRTRFNAKQSPEDLLVLSRTCYGGVMRFTRKGKISTPMGPHQPMAADKLAIYMDEWHERLRNTTFVMQDFRETMAEAKKNAVVYCDPPYLHGQSILYGAQDFRPEDLWQSVAEAVKRGACVAVSLDGWRQSGRKRIDPQLPADLFKRELLLERGGCMLRRFQMSGEDMGLERVADRLLLTW